MATSLSEQLKRLRTPQTSALLQDKRKPSLLFDTKEAANLGKDTVYNIGLSGLDELIKLCNEFYEFKKSLFSSSSIDLQRSVQDQTMNKKLDKEIEKFLVLLSPYFLLNTAHKALEWLIHRFQIHHYNKDHYVLLILPYHESRIFIRALQIVDLSDSRDRWNWLKPLQKTRTPLPPLTVIHQVKTDNGLLKLICDHVIFATKTYSNYATNLNTLYAFYTIALLGTIEKSNTVNDVQFNHILPTLIKGLASKVPDFAASSYIIFAKLVTKIHLRDEIMDKLVLKSIRNPVLTQEAMVLISFLYDNPFNNLTAVSENLMLNFTEKQWFIETIIKVKNSGVNISNFIVHLLSAALSYISKHGDADDSEPVKIMVNEVFNQIPFTDAEIFLIIQKTLTTDVVSEENSHSVRNFIVTLFQSVEKKYPTSFDKYLHNLMHIKESSPHTREVLNFFTLWYSKAEGSLGIYTGLNHGIAEHRIIAIRMLEKNNLAIPEDLKEMVNNSLLARFNDDNDRVIEALLNLPISLLQSTIAVDTLVDELLILVSRCHNEKRKTLAKPALRVLLKVCDESDDTNVFLVVLPYLFPTRNEDVDVSMQVLKSDFAKRNSYFEAVAEEVGESPSAENLRSVAFHNILISNLLPPAASILSAIRQQMTHGDAASVFFNMIVLGSVCRVPVGSLSPEIARQAIEMSAEMVKKFPHVLPLKGATHINADKLFDALLYVQKGHLPLQVITYVLEMVHRRLDLSSSTFYFEEDFKTSQLTLRIIEVVLDGMNLEIWRNNYPEWKAHYEWYLKIFFQRHFRKIEDSIIFLSHLYIKPVKTQTSLHCLKICSKLLDTCESYQWAYNNKTFIVHLLLALHSKNKTCREAAVDILKKLSLTFNISKEGFSVFLSELLDRNLEISLDADQVPLILYSLLSPDPDVSEQLNIDLRSKLKQTREILFEEILNEQYPMHLRAQLLEVLVYVNGADIVEKLIHLGLKLSQDSNIQEKIFAQIVLSNILHRFDSGSVTAFKNKVVWDFFLNCISNHTTEISIDHIPQYISVIVLKQIDEVFFSKIANVASNLQKDLFAKLIDNVTDCEIDSIINTTTKLLKKINVHAKLIVDELTLILTVEKDETETDSASNKSVTKRRKSLAKFSKKYNPEIIHTRKWKKLVTLLEFIQRSENISEEKLLVPVLFDILKTTLGFDEQSPVEYTNQLILSTIHQLALKSIPFENPDSSIDLISQCIRISKNPQTHHHALSVLVEMFKLADVQRALQNIMPIFTFMGSTVLRQDDAYSIQIISKTIDTVVPIITSTNNVNYVCELLRLFITSLPDIPEHRRDPLFTKLLYLLDDYLHLYYLLTFESHVVSKRMEHSQDVTSEKIKYALAISQKFPIQRIISVCIELMKFLRELPEEVPENEKHSLFFQSKHIFDVANNTPKQLRHYKYTTVRFLMQLLSDVELINRIAELDGKEVESLKPLYDTMLIELVLFIKNTTKNADYHQGKPNGKYWKVMLHGLYEILDLVNNLLPNEIFIESIARLINNESVVVRRKALDLLNARFIHKKFSEDDYDSLVALINPITITLSGPHKFINPEVETIQQTALISLKLLAKLLGSSHPDIFKPILELTTELLRKREGSVLSSAVLCVAELCSSMRVHAIQSLNKFVPAIIKLLKKHCNQEIPDVLTISIISALQKIVESVGNFLSLYLDKLLSELSRLHYLYKDTEHQKIGMVVSRLKAIKQKLSSCIPLRVLLPAVDKTYDYMLSNKHYEYIAPLMTIIAESFRTLQTSELSNAIPDLANFFLKVLQFREEVAMSEDDMEVDGNDILTNITNVEESASQAVVALVLKLSETTFRPLYYRLYDWAARNPQHKQRNITFYRLSANIAECLKSLFVLFAGHIVKHAASLLTGNNIILTCEEPLETTLDSEDSKIELVEEILLTLLRVFTYDAHDFVNQERFEILMQPLVDQIENTLGTKEEYEKRAKDFIAPCIAAFAGAIRDDSLHKQLVYQVLLKTRHAKSHVRNTALSSLVEIVRKLGEDFMPLLPETVPFLAELLEDEDEVTEKNAQNAVRELEDILGEPLQKYF